MQYLTYTGPKVAGRLVIRLEPASSPFRYFNYEKGKRYYIGLDIPESIAKWIMSYHNDIFKHGEEDEVSGRVRFKRALIELLDAYVDGGAGGNAMEAVGLMGEALIEEVGGEEIDAELMADLREMIDFAFSEVFSILTEVGEDGEGEGEEGKLDQGCDQEARFVEEGVGGEEGGGYSGSGTGGSSEQEDEGREVDEGRSEGATCEDVEGHEQREEEEEKEGLKKGGLIPDGDS